LSILIKGLQSVPGEYIDVRIYRNGSAARLDTDDTYTTEKLPANHGRCIDGDLLMDELRDNYWSSVDGAEIIEMVEGLLDECIIDAEDHE
jgi:hypothetical protein